MRPEEEGTFSFVDMTNSYLDLGPVSLSLFMKARTGEIIVAEFESISLSTNIVIVSKNKRESIIFY